MARVLIACERSGVVRRAFRALGHDAFSCDLVPADDGSEYHLEFDVRLALDGFMHPAPMGWSVRPWDCMIAFPPCTHLCVSGARWFKDKQTEQAAAVEFFRALLDAPIPHIAVENPIGVISTKIRKPDQIIHPWQFGHGETKATCLWLKNLPLLTLTNIVEGREQRIHKIGPSKDRGMLRSVTYEGIANAFANQWGKLL